MLIEFETLHTDAPALTPGAVHMWPLPVDAEAWPGIDWASLLSKDEWVRARRFKYAPDAYRYTASRALLRIVLASYLRLDPRDLVFDYSTNGKPFLSRGGQLRFNLSHSHDVALIGVTHGRQIGVDVERIRDDLEVEQIARQFFSKAEQSALATLPAIRRQRAFFDCWTRKEAFVKARGDGLSLPLDQFDVSLRPDEPARLLATRPDASEAAAWEAAAVAVGPGYAGAVITQTGPVPLSYAVIDARTLWLAALTASAGRASRKDVCRSSFSIR
jgi:4'-phosphopantetheinyl transferase